MASCWVFVSSPLDLAVVYRNFIFVSQWTNSLPFVLSWSLSSHSHPRQKQTKVTCQLVRLRGRFPKSYWCCSLRDATWIRILMHTEEALKRCGRTPIWITRVTAPSGALEQTVHFIGVDSCLAPMVSYRVTWMCRRSQHEEEGVRLV